MIDKTYQPGLVEGRIYRTWEQAGAFRAGRPERADAKPYSIVIPPPNVTGSLHMGHALNNTLQDILARFERMRGRDVLWQPGTDHAGIATQMVVERQLMERQLPGRREMGRDAFLKRVWEWKAESGGTIVNQLKRLGASCDWSRERFTMDEGLSKAVLKVFVELYREGLIYKDKRLVNWDPKLLTAISDLEVIQVETKGHLWHLRYPIEGKTFNPEDPSSFIVVATTRPETMLGDTAVAVHPDDERYKDYVAAFKAGKAVNVILPLVGRRIPIIADEYSDPEKGSGAVKITPAHDFNDFEVGKRHNLPQVNIFTVEAKVTFADEAFAGQSGAEFAETKKLEGTDRFAARKQIVAWLEAMNMVETIEPNSHVVPHGDRSNVVIEPYLTDQWYVNAKKLAEPAIAAVRAGKTKFVPQNWENTYFNWMENIQPWCISRQLWWGHQIPAWYGPKIEVKGGDTLAVAIKFQSDPSNLGRADNLERFVAETEAEALELAKAYYGSEVRIAEDARDWASRKDGHIRIWRDPDVLDTWFSSALWPFSTLGWPDKTPELNRYYPTNALVTGFDIIFFWVARMMMMGLHFMKEVPFADVYIHRLVRDAQGAKMSKSKGNVVDPLGIIDQYGADALRFTLARGAAQGHDIRLGAQDVENNRNFATKLWNAARFAEMNECASVEGFDPASARQTLNRWIAHETAKAIAEITAAIESYRFNDAAASAYRFVWNIYCDWYLELAKPLLTGSDAAAKAETRAMVAWARDQILKLLHPFMPFVTEELWGVTAVGTHGVSPSPLEGEGREGGKQPALSSPIPPSPSLPLKGGERSSLLALSSWPALSFTDDKAEAEIGWVIDLITAIRSVRAEMNITAQIPLVLAGGAAETKARAERWAEFIKRLARVSEISSAASAPAGSVQLLVRGEVAALPLKGVIDLAAERARLAKEMQKADADIARVDAKLSNANFVARAPEEVVEEEKEKRAEAVARKAKIAEALERLKGAA
ncbi:MAG TPA: valine--tRNA ligase [Pseudolabrys sp.]|nr:valine--tRNA ligase [Pseudolabrys sp.]